MAITKNEFKRLSPGKTVFTNSGRPVKVIENDSHNAILKGEAWWSNEALNLRCPSPDPEVNIALSRMGTMMLPGSAPNWQQAVMLYDPATGAERPYPSHAAQWRQYHGKMAWLYNPWTGKPRDARDIGTDVMGMLVESDASSPSQATAATANLDAIKDAIKVSREIPAFLRRGSD